MNELKYLYFFDAPEIEIIEIKRLNLRDDAPLSDVYKWLVVFRSTQKILEMEFKGMDDHSRTFVEGFLNFTESTFTLLGRNFSVRKENSEKIPQETKDLVQSFLSNKLTAPYRALKVSDLQSFHRWISDKEVIRYSLTKFHQMTSLDEVSNWFLSTLIDPKVYQLGIMDEATGELIGYTGIAGLNDVDQNGEFFILIGEKSQWGKGIARPLAR